MMMCDINAFNSFSVDKDVPCCWRFSSTAISFSNLSICVTFKPVLDNITIGGFGRTLSYIILHDFWNGTSSSGCRLSLKDKIICRDNSTLDSLLEDILGLFVMNPVLRFTHQW